MDKLLGKNLGELEELACKAGLKPYSAGQMADWLYKKHVKRIEEMSNIPKTGRGFLGERYITGRTDPLKVQASADGTKKYLFGTKGGYIEAAYIPELNRATLCLSSQVGCKMGCLFCMTGRQGFQGNLDAGEILNQYASLPERDQVSNIVYMGMGEPLDNLDAVLRSAEIFTSGYGYAMSPRRITVSTIGIIPAMQVFLEKSECHLAVSLHSPFEEERKYLLPLEAVHPAREIARLLRTYRLGKQRRVSFEYIMFAGINDTARHVNELARLLNGIRCRINLIRFHPFQGSALRPSDEDTITQFMLKLNARGIRTTIRASRGQDIDAACGLLSTKEMM